MFVLLPTYLTPLAEVDVHLPAHRDWLAAQFAAGRFLMAGRQVPREGGFILAADGDRAEVERLAETDPFTVAGVARYEVIEVLPTGGAPGFLTALTEHGVRVAQPN